MPKGIAWFDGEISRRRVEQGKFFIAQVQPIDRAIWPQALKDDDGHTPPGYFFYSREPDDEGRPFCWDGSTDNRNDYVRERHSLKSALKKRLTGIREQNATLNQQRLSRELPDGTSIPANPYPGLRSFRKDEAAIFFGRDRMIDNVLGLLKDSHLVTVHGSSGCGKSSLVRAGILPTLEKPANGHAWRTTTMRPGNSPLWNLAKSITRLNEGLDDEAEPSIETVEAVLRFLDQGQSALKKVALFGDADVKACLVIDQFEEIFQHAANDGRDEVETLISALRGFAEDPPDQLYTIITMRSDFLGECANFDGFAELINACVYLVPRMDDKELIAAIDGPALLGGRQIPFKMRLKLIDEAGKEQDALPLIQHNLMRYWDQQQKGKSPSSGDLSSGLSEHADEVLDELCLFRRSELLGDVAYETVEFVAEHLFRALTDIDAEGRAIRRPQRLSTLQGLFEPDHQRKMIVEPIIHRFEEPDCGFLNRTSDQDPAIDISHEAFIRCWQK